MNKTKLDTFFHLARTISKLSPDSETQVGAVAVHPESYDVILPSYNGFISGTNAVLPTVRPEKHQFMVHAEANMVCQAARKGRSLEGYWSIQTLSPCATCLRLLYQSGIRTIVFSDKYKNYTQEIEKCKDMQIMITQLGEYTKLELEPVRND